MLRVRRATPGAHADGHLRRRGAQTGRLLRWSPSTSRGETVKPLRRATRRLVGPCADPAARRPRFRAGGFREKTFFSHLPHAIAAGELLDGVANLLLSVVTEGIGNLEVLPGRLARVGGGWVRSQLRLAEQPR